MNALNLLTFGLSFTLGVCYGIVIVVACVKKYGRFVWDKKKHIVLVLEK